MEKLKLSIVTVTYNNLVGLRRTSDSVMAQSCRDFEWIVIDGGSSDGTKGFLEDLHHPPDWWVSEPDQGIYHAMNKGILHANGEYVICMNAGDEFHDDKVIENILKSRCSADVVYGDWVRCYSGWKELCKAPERLPPFYFFWDNLCHQAMVVKTSLLVTHPFDERFHVLADLEKWRQFMLENRSFQYIPITICNFEAGKGLSEKPSLQLEEDYHLMLTIFPAGLIENGALMRKYVEMFVCVEKIRKFRIVAVIVLVDRKLQAWRRQGCRRTFANAWKTVKKILKKKG